MAKTPKSTQNFVSIKEIRDQVVILKDGNYRSVILVSSINFALKSTDEKTAILMQYQNFLNSLDFPIQIHLQSRRLDIAPYLLSLETYTKNQTNELLKLQTKEYIDFIKTFTESANIMSKNFFMVIPYEPAAINNKESFINKIPLPFTKKGSDKSLTNNIDFEENKLQLDQRVAVVMDGLGRLGVKTVRLNTDELIELYFKIFNPGEVGIPTNIS